LIVAELPIVIDNQLSWRDYYVANLLHQRRPSQRYIIAGLGVAMFILLAFEAESVWSFVILVLVFLGLWAGLVQLMRLWTRARCRKVYDQQVMLQLPYRLVFEAGSISCSSERGETRYKLHELVRWAEDDAMFLLYFSDVMFLMVPKRSFATPADQDRLRALLLGVLPR
jgi:hypothetical protein